jgi:hypothetical protein
MQPARLVCEGASVGPYDLPPFQLRAGDLICLHLAAPADYIAEATLLRALTGREPHPGLRPLSRVLDASPAARRRGLWRLLGQPTLARWLAHASGIPFAEATHQLAELGLLPSARLDCVAGTPRTLLGLACAWNRGAEAVIFTTAGLDPLGREAVVNAVRSRLERCPAILLSYPYLTSGETRRDCPPGARCLESHRGAAA